LSSVTSTMARLTTSTSRQSLPARSAPMRTCSIIFGKAPWGQRLKMTPSPTSAAVSIIFGRSAAR